MRAGGRRPEAVRGAQPAAAGGRVTAPGARRREGSRNEGLLGGPWQCGRVPAERLVTAAVRVDAAASFRPRDGGPSDKAPGAEAARLGAASGYRVGCSGPRGGDRDATIRVDAAASLGPHSDEPTPGAGEEIRKGRHGGFQARRRSARTRCGRGGAGRDEGGEQSEGGEAREKDGAATERRGHGRLLSARRSGAGRRRPAGRASRRSGARGHVKRSPDSHAVCTDWGGEESAQRS